MGTGFFGQFKQISKTIAMILSWTIFALLLLIIGFLVYYLVCTNIYASKGEKFEPKFSLYTIVSPSMEPNINVYDVILNTRVDDPSEIKVGDVITFISTSNISNGMTVTHRVTKIVQGPNGLEFKTKGDNNLSEDTDTAKADNVLGKVFLKIPQLGRLQFFLSSNGGWLIVIVCPALFIIVNDIFKIIKLNKAKKAISDVDNDGPDDEKIELEAFRKEEIKEKLNKKELKKANMLAEKIKNNTKKDETIEEILHDENKTKEINENDEEKEIDVNVEEIVNIEEQEIQNLIDSDEDNQNKNEAEKQEEIMFEPIILDSEDNKKTSKKTVQKNKNKNKKKVNNKKKATNKKESDKSLQNSEEYNIFGEKKEEYNIFSDNYVVKKEIVSKNKVLEQEKTEKEVKEEKAINNKKSNNKSKKNNSKKKKNNKKSTNTKSIKKEEITENKKISEEIINENKNPFENSNKNATSTSNFNFELPKLKDEE